MAKKTKGLSFDEKKAVLQKAMIREGSYYNLKELEVLGKKNGVIPQAVKEVVDCLVDDRAVIQEKIGSLNIFWSFASNESSLLENQLSQIRNNLSSTSTAMDASSNRLITMKATYPDMTSLAVAEVSKEASSLNQECVEAEAKLNSLLKSDPVTIANLFESVQRTRDRINMWTDNIYILRQFLTSKLGVTTQMINAEFGISDDLDLV